MWIISSFLIHCFLTVYVAQCNIDILQPIIRSSPEVNVTRKDLFGYKVVLHQLVSQGGINNTRIVVSAPYGQALNAVLQRKNNSDLDSDPTGVIYTCPIIPGQCEGLVGDGQEDTRRLYDVDGNAVSSDGTQLEEKRGQFLGSTLKSTGDTFLVCGHRYLDYGEGSYRSPYGICYISGRSLMTFQNYSPCYRNSRSFFAHGVCQAGTAGDIINGSILLGAPGMYAWRGAVFRRSNTGQTIFSDNGVGSDSISWQGYEVVTGRINSQNLQDFIVSVPRFNNYRGRVNIYANIDGSLRPTGNPPLAGNQIGEYYGFSVAAVDLQGLGMDDLLVSAPMYSPEIDKPEYGIVYVYRNNQGALSLFTTLEGTILFGRFGYAVAKLGDINGDSFEDVAISCPFGDQPGAVYIYAGAGSDIINPNPIQTIVGTSLNLPQLSGLRSFGSSLSSNIDVDNNGYNDLVVGAYLSQKVFLLRTRPVARLAVNISHGVTQYCNNQSCFDISSCMMYSGAGLHNYLEINYELSVTAPISVRLSQEVGDVFTGRISGSLTLVKDQQMCVNTTAILEEELMDTTGFEVQFIPTLVNNNSMPNPAWDGNMPLSSLESAPVLSVVGDTSAPISIQTSRTERMSPEQGSSADQHCSSATNCAECFMSSADCIWCAQPNYTTTALGQKNSRCVRRDDDHGCDPKFIEDPTGSTTITMNQPFGGDDFIQVSPQRLQVSLRPGQPHSFTVTVHPVDNFPADIYFLMDQSFSMNDDLENLRNVASQLAETVHNITENFQLGFGSFVDKRRTPYISLVPDRLTDPCQADGVSCQPAYSFHHTLNFTSNANLFTSRIQEEIISGNLDSPEGGFDAMLQVIVCENIIEWRENARRILVYISDAGFHFAGDGKLGGIAVPHDGQCYLEQRGNIFEYTMAEKLDYPSVGQISYLLKKFDIIPIFAAAELAQPFYESLREVLDFAVVGTLATDSSNIVDLIRDTYNSVSQTVRLVPESLPGVKVEITPMCENVVDSTCTGVGIEQNASFSVTLTADELINSTNWTVTIPGFGQFVVELTGVSDCSCTSNPMKNSNFCNDGNGDLVCGQCICDPGWFGKTCECTDPVEDCPLGNNGIECTSNERGTCVCGTCQCNQLDAERRYFGSACECDNFSCDRDIRSLICGGPSRGICGCDQTCICLPGWKGRACDCTLSSGLCINPFGLICSGQGNCECGKCLCNHEYLSGAFCEICTGNETECPTLPVPSVIPTVVTGPCPPNIKGKARYKIDKKKVKLSFSADNPDATFTCQLEDQDPEPCKSPMSWVEELDKGKYTITLYTSCIGTDNTTITSDRKFYFKVT